MDEAAARRLLGVSPFATRQDIEAAFRARARATHPDRGGQAELFRSTVEARRTLLDPPVRRPPAVTVVPDVPLIRQVFVAVVRRLLDRPPPGPRVR